jgi:hypothetical protein
MSALLALLPAKDWIYGGVIVALLIGFGAYTVHERRVGAAKVVAADTKLADEQKAHVADVQATAAKTSAAVEAQYESDVDTLSTPAPRVVCIAPGRRAVPQAAGGSGSAIQGAQSGVPASGSGGDDSIDIGPPLTLAGHRSDSQVKALQQDVGALLKEMGAQ